MRKLFFLLLFLGILTMPAAAERAGNELNAQKSIVGHTDPEFDATLPASPLNHFMKDMFRPDHPIEGEPTSYEEAVPVGGSYYPNEGRYYEKEKTAVPGASPKKEEKNYYEESGHYYPSPEEK